MKIDPGKLHGEGKEGHDVCLLELLNLVMGRAMNGCTKASCISLLRDYGEHRMQLGFGAGIAHERNRRSAEIMRQAASDLGEPGIYGD